MALLRIGYYLTSRELGGMERHLLALIRHAQQTHQCAVFGDVSEELDSFYREVEATGARLRTMRVDRTPANGVVRSALRSLPAILAARAELAAAHLDVIHFHAGRLGLEYPAILASRIARIPRCILTLHNPVNKGSARQRTVESFVLRCLHQIIAVSPEVKENLADAKGVAPDRVRVIPNGVDVAEFHLGSKEEARKALGIPADSRVVGMVARLHPQKGADLLLRAAPIIRSQVENLSVVLVGSGPEKERLGRLAQELRVSDIVVFAGYRADAQRLFRAFDVVVLPSRSEGLPLTLLEAMASALPVVGTTVGGIAGAAVDGVTGLLVPPEDVAALAQAIVKLLHDPRRRDEMGQAGRERAEILFSQEAMLRQTVSLYTPELLNP